MPSNTDLSKELLTQNGIRSDETSEEDRKRIYELIAKDKVRLKRIRWATGTTGALALVGFIMAAVGEALRSRAVDIDHTLGTDFIDIANLVTVLFLCCAVGLSVTRRRGREHRNQLMEARLASIEDQLKRLAEKH